MTVSDFLLRCEEIYGGKSLTENQITAYRQKLIGFTDNERAEIQEHLTENCTRFPKIADIYESARALGYIGTKQPEYKPHTWGPTGCNKCGGEGRISAFYSREFENSEAGLFIVEKLEKIQPYSLAGGGYVFRCSCLAGDLPTVEKGLTRWSRDVPAVRRRSW